MSLQISPKQRVARHLYFSSGFSELPFFNDACEPAHDRCGHLHTCGQGANATDLFTDTAYPSGTLKRYSQQDVGQSGDCHHLRFCTGVFGPGGSARRAQTRYRLFSAVTALHFPSCCGIQTADPGLVPSQHSFDVPFCVTQIPPLMAWLSPLAYCSGWTSPGWSHLTTTTAGAFPHGPHGPLAGGPAGYRSRSRCPGRWSFGSCGHCGGRRRDRPSCLAGGPVACKRHPYVTIPLWKSDDFVSVNFYVALGRWPTSGEEPDR